MNAGYFKYLNYNYHSSQVWFKWRNENQEIRLLGFSSGPKKKTKLTEESSAAIVEVATAGEEANMELVVVLEESVAEAVEVHSPQSPSEVKNCTSLSLKGENCLLPSSVGSSSNLVLSSSLLHPPCPLKPPPPPRVSSQL